MRIVWTILILFGCSTAPPSNSIDPSVRPRNVTIKLKESDENKVNVYILKTDTIILKRDSL